LTSFAAREVFVGTLATIYSVGNDEEETIKNRMAAELDEDGEPLFNLASGISLMLFYAFAMQCMSTLAIVKRETNSWKWPMIQLGFMSVFAYITLIIYWTGKRWKKILGSFVVTFLMLFFIDFVAQGIDWALLVALPLLLGTYGIGLALYLVAHRMKYYGFNLLAYLFLGLAVLLMLLEGTLSYYHHNALMLDWSIIVLISFLPVDAVLFYIHFRLKKNPDLKKIFHI